MKFILLTCDTEIGETPGNLSDPFKILIEGDVEGQRVGYSLVNLIANQHGAVVTHFVDVFSMRGYDENRYRRLCESILEDGHLIGLHTHPASSFDPHRKWMYQYSLEEQTKILLKGKELIFHWTGEEVKHHRAGGYGADDCTMDALAQTGFQMDCSYFANHSQCKITPAALNTCFQHAGVWEIPITVCQNVGSLSLSKLDWRYSLSSRDILAAIRQAPDGAVITLFLHSFNFLRLIYDLRINQFEPPKVDQHLINEYEALLAALQNDSQCRFATLNDVVPQKAKQPYMPRVYSLARFQKRLRQEYLRVFKQKIAL